MALHEAPQFFGTPVLFSTLPKDHHALFAFVPLFMPDDNPGNVSDSQTRYYDLTIYRIANKAQEDQVDHALEECIVAYPAPGRDQEHRSIQAGRAGFHLWQTDLCADPLQESDTLFGDE